MREDLRVILFPKPQDQLRGLLERLVEHVKKPADEMPEWLRSLVEERFGR